MGKLTGKVAIVTASTEGIGYAIAKRLAEDGANVMISSRKKANVDKAVQTLRQQGLTVSGVVCHVGKAEDRRKMIEQTVSEFGGVDILVSNAAVNPIFGPILDTSEQAWDKIFEINVKSSFFLAKEVVPLMDKRGGGAMVFVSSVGGFSPSELMGAYAISKTAMLGMVKALVPQLSTFNIRVNGIAPGLIRTKFSGPIWKSGASKDYEQTIPLKRMGESDECAGIVSFLTSKDASYITGENIVINGGIPSRL